MKNIKTFQGTEERLNGNVGAGLNKVVCVVIVLILFVLVCVGGFFWYKHSKNKELNPLEQSGEKIESGEIEGTNGVAGGNLSGNELEAMSLQVGDYVLYTADIDANVDWRVWKIEGDNVVIVPTDPLGDLTLEGAEDWLNAEEKIEDECDKYISTSLGITADNIRSMKIEDIEEVLPENETKQGADFSIYGKDYTYSSGTFYAEKANESDIKFDEYNTVLSSAKTASSSSPVKLKSTYWYKSSPTWTKLNNTKSGMKGDTYGTILGNIYGWLASHCVYCYSNFAYFNVYYVDSSYVYGNYLYTSDGDTYSNSHGVRPLVTLSSEFLTGEGEGTSSNPWQLNG